MIDTVAAAQTDQLQARRAIEALRAGVPNRDAVTALDSSAPVIEDRFQRLLSGAAERGVEAPGPNGFMLAGNFGAGKSHLLESLQHRAMAQGFVTSKIVVSKETPFYDPAKLYRAAINSARAPSRRGALLGQITAEINPHSDEFVEFFSWVQQARPEVLNQRFAATLYLFEHARHHDPELYERILAFWAGDPIGIGDLKRALREYGERVTYVFDKIDPKSLAQQRFRFVARLILASNYHGWVLLVDEAELIGRYSVLQRARSYVELARWTGAGGESIPGTIAVFAITSDFETMLLDVRHDRDNVPNKLRASTREADQKLATLAERGMRAIGRADRIPAPTKAGVRRTYQRVRELYALAYAWDPLPVGSPPYATSTSIREYIRWWITEWDLVRLFPGYVPEIEATPLTVDYSEDADLESSLDLPADQAGSGDA
jgi:hypothetical protein